LGPADISVSILPRIAAGSCLHAEAPSIQEKAVGLDRPPAGIDGFAGVLQLAKVGGTESKEE